MKKALVILVCMVIALSCVNVTAFAEEQASTYSNNLSNVSSDFYINNGSATVYVSYRGIPDVTTNAVIKVKIQKRFLLVFWQDVDGGEWTDYANEVNYSNFYSVSVKTGTYRAQIEYTIYGSGGTADVITNAATNDIIK